MIQNLAFEKKKDKYLLILFAFESLKKMHLHCSFSFGVNYCYKLNC